MLKASLQIHVQILKTYLGNISKKKKSIHENNMFISCKESPLYNNLTEHFSRHLRVQKYVKTFGYMQNMFVNPILAYLCV